MRWVSWGTTSGADPSSDGTQIKLVPLSNHLLLHKPLASSFLPTCPDTGFRLETTVSGINNRKSLSIKTHLGGQTPKQSTCPVLPRNPDFLAGIPSAKMEQGYSAMWMPFVLLSLPGECVGGSGMRVGYSAESDCGIPGAKGLKVQSEM